ncbi:MAG: hypothetical protein JXA90_00710, partial [Planctomycetes bacterium]|nr:hypothetical protein [Planctomycetota bacterium]
MPPNYTRKNGFLELGSTTIKLYVVPPGGEHAGEVEREIKVPWDLGYDVFEKGRISPGTVSHCLRTLREFQQQFPEIPFETVAAVGTAALREAQNAEVLQRILWEDLRLKIQIIEGGIEAFLLETGFRSMVEAYPTALFDLGGGSLELIEYLTHASTRKTSIPVGAIRLHCQLRRTRDMCEYVREGRRKVASALREHLSDQLMAYDTLLGTGGTVRAITRCAGREEFEIGEIQDLIQREIHGPIWHDLDPHRRKLLLPGLIAVEGLFTTLGVERILYRKASVKRG